jgi:hypothetical protein
MSILSRVGAACAAVGAALLIWWLVGGTWLAHGMPGAILAFIGVVQVGVTQFVSKAFGNLQAPTFADMNQSMALATEMMARGRLRDTLRGSGVKATLTLVEATPTGAQWQHMPVHELRMRHQVGPAEPLVDITIREAVPVTCVPRLVPGSTWSGFVDPQDPQQAFVDW